MQDACAWRFGTSGCERSSEQCGGAKTSNITARIDRSRRYGVIESRKGIHWRPFGLCISDTSNCARARLISSCMKSSSSIFFAAIHLVSGGQWWRRDKNSQSFVNESILSDSDYTVPSLHDDRLRLTKAHSLPRITRIASYRWPEREAVYYI